jgi:nicotinamide mononucleotide adenylyltransferase/adenylate kinase family enzyme
MKFLDFIDENLSKKDNHAVMSFGRMNPITKGHEKLVNKVQQVARQVGGSHHVVLSHSQDKNKNPLSAADKLKHAKKAFPRANLSTSDKKNPNYLQQAAKLHKKGVTHLHVVAGSDRVPEFSKTLNKYNGTHSKALYNFKNIKVHSSGERDPDSPSVSGISGTKMRGHAAAGNYKAFKSGAPSGMTDSHVKHMYKDTRKGMKIAEDVAVFLIGGPGSGKDYIFKSVLEDFNLREVNTDKAFEYIMEKRYDTHERSNLVINGNAHEIKTLSKIKEKLEEQNYKTTMVLVSTTNDVSKLRNESRKRVMNEELRHQKWELVNMVKPYFEDVFKEDYIEFDNSEDLTEDHFQERIFDLKEWLEDKMSNNIKGIDELFEDTFEEDLRKWFSKDHPQGDWKRVDTKGNVVGPCARKPGEPKPKCMSKATRAKLSKKERAAAVRTKRKHDKVADRAGKGGKPVMVSSFGKGKLTKEDLSNEYDWKYDKESDQRGNRQSFGRVLEREFSEAVSHKTKKSKLGTKNVNDTFNAWYTGSQVSKYYKPNELSEESEKAKKATKQQESIDKGIEPGMALNSYSKEYNSLRTKGRVRKGQVVPFKELTGDTTGASISAQKEDELKKVGINLKTFKAKRFPGTG